jgi:hypothetical protein
MVTYRSKSGSKKKYQGGLISLRLSKVCYLPKKKRTLMIETGTGMEMFFKFSSQKDKTEWAEALAATMEWVDATNLTHLSLNTGQFTSSHISMVRQIEEEDEDDEGFD